MIQYAKKLGKVTNISKYILKMSRIDYFIKTLHYALNCVLHFI